MSAPIIGFFNNKGGIGKTSLVYHLAWMYADLELRVVAADLDPQANLTAAFLDEARLEELWPDGPHPNTVFGCVEPLLKGTGDIRAAHLEEISPELGLLVGDLLLSGFEDELSDVWPKAVDGPERPFRVLSVFWRMMQAAAEAHTADVVLMDLGPNLGAISRVALIAADYVVIPVSPDLFSLQGLRNLGPTLRRWREEWVERVKKNPDHDLQLPSGRMEPAGYVVLQHAVRLDRPVRAYERWMARVPQTYRASIIGEEDDSEISVRDDPNCLASIKHYRSLMPLAQEARKPIFHLKPADGALGSHLQAAIEAGRDFERLARAIASRTGLALDRPS